MSFKNKEIKKLPNQEDILSRITDREIFELYLGGIPKKTINSPLREDKVPSFSIFYSYKYQKYMFKDFATGEVGDAFVFVMRLLGLRNITDAFCQIAYDFNLNEFETKKAIPFVKQNLIDPKNILKNKSKDKIKIGVKIREWQDIDSEYWNGKYGLTRQQVRHCGIFPISHYFINDFPKKADEIAYAFLETKDGKPTYKIYQPFNKHDHKWINNNDYSVWELWKQLPKKGNILIITSSRKDAIVLKSCFPSNKVTSCSLQSENVNPKEKVINELKSRFKKIYVLYDNDFDNENNPGRSAGKKLSDKFNIKQIEIPFDFKIKDPSDFIEKHGKNKLKELIKKLIKQCQQKEQ